MSFARRHANQHQRVLHILVCGQHRHEAEPLEDEADVARAEIRERSVRKPPDILAANLDPPARRRVDTADQVEQRGFAAAGGTNDHAEALRRDRHADIADRGDIDLPGVIGLPGHDRARQRAGRRSSGNDSIPVVLTGTAYMVPGSTKARGV